MVLEVWEEIAVKLMEKKKITFSSKFEANIAATMGVLGIDFHYKGLQFYMEYGDTILTYTPDFVLDERVNGKQVLIEPHGKKYIDKRFIEKMHAFEKSSAGRDYYNIIITDKMPKKPDKFKIELRKYGYKPEDICKEVWSVPYNPVLDVQLNIKNESGSLYTKFNALKRQNEYDHKSEATMCLLRTDKNRENHFERSYDMQIRRNGDAEQRSTISRGHSMQ